MKGNVIKWETWTGVFRRVARLTTRCRPIMQVVSLWRPTWTSPRSHRYTSHRPVLDLLRSCPNQSTARSGRLSQSISLPFGLRAPSRLWALSTDGVSFFLFSFFLFSSVPAGPPRSRLEFFFQFFNFLTFRFFNNPSCDRCPPCEVPGARLVWRPSP